MAGGAATGLVITIFLGWTQRSPVGMSAKKTSNAHFVGLRYAGTLTSRWER